MNSHKQLAIEAKFLSLSGQAPFSNSTTTYQFVPNNPMTVVMPTHQLPSALAAGLTGDPHLITGWQLLPPGPAATAIFPGTNMATITPIAAPNAVPSEHPSCSQCSIFFESVSVFYWPAKSSNTDCLTLLTNFASPTSLPGLSPEFPSVYVVFPAVSAGNPCTQVGKIYTSVIIKFAPEALSTLEGQSEVPKSFNFADIPCPPPDVASNDAFFYNPQFNPGRQYAPRLAPPTGLWALDPEFQKCVSANIYQGFDPPSALPHATRTSPADSTPKHIAYPGHSHHKRAAARAYRTPRFPKRTPESVY